MEGESKKGKDDNRKVENKKKQKKTERWESKLQKTANLSRTMIDDMRKITEGKRKIIENCK